MTKDWCKSVMMTQLWLFKIQHQKNIQTFFKHPQTSNAIENVWQAQNFYCGNFKKSLSISQSRLASITATSLQHFGKITFFNPTRI
jgi:hypothetical protein